jgi:GAF domain-containing protein
VIDLRSETRFPQFSPRASADRLAAVFTFPMRLDGDRLGALYLYRDTPGGLSKADLKAAQVLADVAAASLFNAQARMDVSTTLPRLDHRSLHDPLTGLPNRTLLKDLLDRAVARARRSHLIAAVLFADLDGFKAVNDRHGHHVGDLLLGAVAARLTRVLRPGTPWPSGRG